MRFVENLSDKEYFASEGISQSSIKTLLEDPFLYFNKIEKSATASMEEGTILHCLLCEPQNLDKKVYVADIERISQKAKEEAGNRILIKKRDFDNLLECVEYVKNFLKREINLDLNTLDGEVACFGEVRGVKAKGKADLITKNRKGIIDIKKTACASPKEFLRTACNLHYGIQEVWYRELMGADVFYWLAIETNPVMTLDGKKHYRLGLYQASEALREQSGILIDKALKVLDNREIFDSVIYPSEFLENDLVNGKQVIKTLEPPLWYLKG